MPDLFSFIFWFKLLSFPIYIRRYSLSWTSHLARTIPEISHHDISFIVFFHVCRGWVVFNTNDSMTFKHFCLYLGPGWLLFLQITSGYLISYISRSTFGQTTTNFGGSKSTFKLRAVFHILDNCCLPFWEHFVRFCSFSLFQSFSPGMLSLRLTRQIHLTILISFLYNTITSSYLAAKPHFHIV